MSIVVVGSVALDSVETPYGKVERALGGSATYFSVAASYFHSPVKLVGIVGSDFDQRHIDLLLSKGIDIEGLERSAGKTFHWSGRYDDLNVAETLLTELNVFADFQPVLPDSYRDAEIIFLANINPGLQLDVLRQVKSPKLVACDTMNLWINTARRELIDLLGRVDLFILNDAEAKLITEEDNLIKAGRALTKLGPSQIVIKKGEHGVISITERGIFAIPAYPVEKVVDPTGAGDSFAGGMLGYIASQKEVTEDVFRRAVAYGAIVASFNVEGFSLTRLSEITRSDIDARFEELRRMSRF